MSACAHLEAPFRAPAQSTQLPQNITRHRTLRRALSALPSVSPVKNPSLVPHLRHNDHFCAPVCKWETLLLLLPKWEILITLPQQQGLSDEKHVFPAHSSLILVFPIAFPHTQKKKKNLKNALASNSTIESHSSITLLSLSVCAFHRKHAQFNDSSLAGCVPCHCSHTPAKIAFLSTTPSLPQKVTDAIFWIVSLGSTRCGDPAL